MPYLKNKIHALNLSPSEVTDYLTSITWQKSQNSSPLKRKAIFCGNITSRTFNLKWNRTYQLFSLHGRVIQNSENSVEIELGGQIVWRNLILNTLIFLMLSLFLFLLTFLLLRENWVEGGIALIIAVIISCGLYRNLIGRLRSNYIKMSSELIHLLSILREIS